MTDKEKMYKKALFTLFDLCLETERDPLIDNIMDIITDTLCGYELMEQYQENATNGEKEFLKLCQPVIE
jgi:hypothetical protein